MRSISGRIEARGPFLDITVMATPHHVAALKVRKLPCPAPVTIRALIDTGGQGSLLDPQIVQRLGLTLAGRVPVHNSSSGPDYILFDQYDISLFLGSTPPNVASYTVGALASELASQGFLATVGWDILKDCILTCDGPAGVFRLEF